MPVITYSRRLHRKTSELTTDILLLHIAPRLPAKSVFRLMAVCKEFHSFLKSHQFTKMHLHHVTNDHRHKFLVLSRDSEREGGWLFSSIDRETTTPSGVTRPSRPVPFLAPEMKVLSSFHGLVCVGIFLTSGEKFTDLILWNTATSDYKILSKPNFNIHVSYRGFGLYYSCGDDDYKLLHVDRQFEVYIYSLRLDSWRKLVMGLERNLMICWSAPCEWLNGNLYFLSGFFNDGIMRFDTITEKITHTKLHLSLKKPDFPIKSVYMSLFVHKGYINLCVRFAGSRGNVIYYTRRMNGDGEWSMVDTYNMDKEVPLTRRLKRRSHLMKNGEWLMIHRFYKNHILYMFDPEKKAYTYTRLSAFRTIPEQGRYTETFVSPNQYVLA